MFGPEPNSSRRPRPPRNTHRATRTSYSYISWQHPCFQIRTIIYVVIDKAVPLPIAEIRDFGMIRLKTTDGTRRIPLSQQIAPCKPGNLYGDTKNCIVIWNSLRIASSLSKHRHYFQNTSIFGDFRVFDFVDRSFFHVAGVYSRLVWRLRSMGCKDFDLLFESKH
jgi:hypothetical protein